MFDDGWSCDEWNAFDWWQDDWVPDREPTEEQQGPPLETSAIIPSLGQPLIEEIDDEAEAVSAALPSQASSSGGCTRAPEPGLMSTLFVGALMLIGTLSSNVPVIHPSDDIELSAQPPALPDPKDPLAEFHLQSGVIDKSWILFDSGASANCAPPWFGQDYPLHPVGSDCPALRSISGKTLNIVGKRIIELDCGGHSMCVHFYVCEAFRSHWSVFLVFYCRTSSPS